MTPNNEERLRLLSIGFYVLGAVTLVSASALLMSTLALGPMFQSLMIGKDFGRAFVADVPRGLLTLGAGLLSLFGYAQIRAGLAISRRRHRTFCLCVGALSAASGPVGVAMAIFALFVLTAPSVKLLFLTSHDGSVSVSQST